MSAAPPLPPGVRWATQRRSLLVQGSWNYRVMQGTGMAFAMLPVLRHVHGRDGALDEAVARHAEHFNAHPYLASVALGALTRLEMDGTDAETVRRFRAAIRGPLGALGDRVVWATWLPLSAVIALVLYWSGLPGWVPVAVFLVLFNALHLVLRSRGFRLGYEAGTRMGLSLKELRLTQRADRAGALLLFLVGALAGLLVNVPAAFGALDWTWVGAALLAFGVGFLGGVRFWRPTALVTVGVVVLITLVGLWAA